MKMKDTLKAARLNFDVGLAEVLLGSPEKTYADIQQEFGVSETVIRRVRKQFQLAPRKRGPKPPGRPEE